MKIKIVSDGTPMGTKVVNAETGEAIKGVCGVSWSLSDNRSIGRAIVEFALVPVELVGDAYTKDIPAGFAQFEPRAKS
jgi:hypothetical protein